MGQRYGYGKMQRNNGKAHHHYGNNNKKAKSDDARNHFKNNTNVNANTNANMNVSPGRNGRRYYVKKVAPGENVSGVKSETVSPARSDTSNSVTVDIDFDREHSPNSSSSTSNNNNGKRLRMYDVKRRNHRFNIDEKWVERVANPPRDINDDA